MWYRMVERIEIEINRTWLGKKYVIRVYDKKWLLESRPYDNLDLFDYIKEWIEKE